MSGRERREGGGRGGKGNVLKREKKKISKWTERQKTIRDIRYKGKKDGTKVKGNEITTVRMFKI